MDAVSARSLPQIDRLLRHPRVEAECAKIRRELVAAVVRREVEKARESLLNGQPPAQMEELVEAIVRELERLRRPSLQRVINGTGVILNTNLGRAPLAPEAVEHIARIASGYCNLEFDLRTGKRGERGQRIEELLSLLTGCQSAIVVNNNAAAVLLCVSALARKKEVIVSRGELIEIGGSFRLPDVIRSAGGILREVGTTNRTRAADYADAVCEKTAMFLRCHRSNFRISGFTAQPATEELLEIARKNNIPLVEDLGSGVLVDLSFAGSIDERTVQSVVAEGCDLVTFSGDKLLGGPQAGIIAGKRQLVQMLRKHPLYRALRADKLVLAALEQTLLMYTVADNGANIPILRMAATPVTVLQHRVSKFVERAKESMQRITCHMASMQSAAGGGSLPGETLDSFGIIVESRLSPNRMSAALRQGNPPVIGIVKDDRLMLDFRTISVDDESDLLRVLAAIDSSQIKGKKAEPRSR